MNLLLSFFIEADIDYQIGVTTTTVTAPAATDNCPEAVIEDIPLNGSLLHDTIIKQNTPGANAVFNELVNVGICGSGLEMGMESAMRVLSQENNAFLREDAFLSVLYVSDEEDASPLPVSDYVNQMRAVKDPVGRDVFKSSALVVQDIDSCSQAQIDGGATLGTRYIDVAEQTNGVVGNICADDISAAVTDLSLNSSRLEDTFFLSEMPDPQSLRVHVDGVEMPCDGTGSAIWSYSLWNDLEPVIIFERNALPPIHSRIDVEYDKGQGWPSDFCTETAEGNE